MFNSVINSSLSLIITFLCLAGNVIIAQDFSAEEFVFANGGGVVESDEFIIDGTIGQAVIGEIENTSYLKQLGFWYSISGISSAEEDIRISGELSVEVYPNPFSDNIKFKLSPKRPGELITIEILDFFGKGVVNVNLQRIFEPAEITIHNLGNLVPGVYFCRINFGDESLIKKAIKISQ